MRQRPTAEKRRKSALAAGLPERYNHPRMAAHPSRRDWLLAAGAALAAPAARPAELTLPKTIRVALVGLDGHIGEAVGVAASHPSVEIVAYTASSPRETQRSRHPALAAAKGYTDFRRMLDEHSVDAVSICDQNWRRVDSVVECLRRNIPTAAWRFFYVQIWRRCKLVCLLLRGWRRVFWTTQYHEWHTTRCVSTAANAQHETQQQRTEACQTVRQDLSSLSVEPRGSVGDTLLIVCPHPKLARTQIGRQFEIFLK